VFVRNDKAGAMILFRNLPFGFTIAYIPEGPLGVPSEGFWHEVSEVCKQKKAIFLKVEPFVWQEDVEELDNLNLEASFKLVTDTVQPPSTIVIDLRDDEDVILARMKQKTRYNIRLAERKGVEVELSEELSTFHDLMKLTGERDAFGVHSEEYYQKAFDLFHTHGKCSLLIASFEGTPLAGVMVFTHGKNAWYLYGASSNEYRNLMPTYLIQWKAMLYAKSLGCEFYDLYGVPDADLETLEESFSAKNDGLWGVYRFKRGFGGDLKRTVGAFDRVFKPVLYRMYQLYRKGL
jgi:lipid II:glycine glycyltransferase (peptidoglycan interpeptide bridge formation enzyme)